MLVQTMDSRPESTSWHRIAPRRPAEWLVLAALLAALAWLGVGAYHRYQERQGRRHPEAMAQWLEWTRNGFHGASTSKIQRTFMDCFRVGDPASEYANLLAAASKDTYGSPPRTSYLWSPEGGAEGDYVVVVIVTGDPPVIESAYVTGIGR
jgi:hypothetical protein